MGECKSLRVTEMKSNGSPHRSYSETTRECPGESLKSSVRSRLGNGTLWDRGGGTSTFVGDVLDFDGVGFANESEDWIIVIIILRHCGRFTSHREKE